MRRGQTAIRPAPWALAMLLGAATTLGGCVAAVIPVAAGGLIGRHELHVRGRHAKGDQPQTAVAKTDAPAPAASPPPAPLPANIASIQPGTLYAGQLPPPSGAAQPAAPVPNASRPVAEAQGGWRDVVRYVAKTSLDPDGRSVLLARGSTARAPIWTSCDSKPLAVVIDLAAVNTRDAAGQSVASIGAIETMGLTPIYISDRDAAAAHGAAAALAPHVATPPVDGKTLFLIRPGAEATTRGLIAARYCAVAIVGTRAADFPNAVLPAQPGASPGWFLLPAG